MVKATSALALVLACSAAGCTTSVRRAALVPHQQPTQRTGQPLARQAEVALGAASILETTEPTADSAGVQIPQTQVNAGMRFRTPVPDLDMGFVWDYGASEGSHKAAADQPTVEHGDVIGGGFTLHYSVATDTPGLRVGLTGDLLLYSVPYVEYQTCIDCEVPWTDVDEEREMVPVLALGVVPSWNLGMVTLFGGVTMRNHPLVERGEISDSVTEELDEEVQAGPLNFIANAGVELGKPGGVRGLVHVYQPLGRDPVQYGPSFGIALSIPLGAAPASTPARPLTASR